MNVMHMIQALLLTLLLLGGQVIRVEAENGAAVVLTTAGQAAAPRQPTPTSRPTQTHRQTPTPQPEATPSVDAKLLAAGKAIYLASYCGVCHTLAAAQTTGIFGPSHDHIGHTARQRIADPTYQGAATTASDYLRESIVAPSTYFAPGAMNGRHPMPSYAHLSDADLDALVYFLLQQQ